MPHPGRFTPTHVLADLIKEAVWAPKLVWKGAELSSFCILLFASLWTYAVIRHFLPTQNGVINNP